MYGDWLVDAGGAVTAGLAAAGGAVNAGIGADAGGGARPGRAEGRGGAIGALRLIICGSMLVGARSTPPGWLLVCAIAADGAKPAVAMDASPIAPMARTTCLMAAVLPYLFTSVAATCP
jgi:hypothetical protein